MEIFNNIELREPAWLLLALQPLVLLGLVFILRRVRHSPYCDSALLPWARAPRAKHLWQQTLRQVILLLAWSALAIALAGPRQAERSYHNDSDDLAEVYLLLDVSRSMSATDVLPNRLARVQLEIQQLLAHTPTLRIGLIVFAARPHLVSPPTTDTAVLTHYLQQLHTRMLPTEGSELAHALMFSARQFSAPRNAARAIVLFTDGELTPATPSSQQAVFDAITALKLHHILLHVVGVGTAAGAALIDAEQGWLQYQGQAVISRLQPQLLEDLAARGHGHYLAISDSRNRWQDLLADDLQPLSRAGATNRDNAIIVWRELYAYPLLAGVLLFVLAHWQPSSWRRRLASAPLWSLLLLLILCSSVSPPLQAAELSYREAYAAYMHKDYLPAVQAFAKLPGYAARLGEGSAFYQLGNYPQASAAFIHATLQASDDAQRARALFNLANCYYKQTNYALAIATYRDVLRYQPDLQAATINLAYAQALYHEQEKSAALIAQRSGRGPRSALAPAALPISQETVTLDDTTANTPLPNFDDTTATQTANELTHAKPAVSTIERSEDRAWTYDIEQIDPAQLPGLLQQHNESYVWQRLFEWEEKFPAPVKSPHALPGVPPW